MLLRVKIAGVNGENLAKVALTKYWYLPYDMKNIYVAAKNIGINIGVQWSLIKV